MISQKTGPVKTFSFDQFTRLFSIIAFISLLFGIKLWLIYTYGNPTPFWDQWDGEAANLYAPFLERTLHLKDLFAAHNEHRIFTTRLLALTELKINGIWNPILQMVINAVLHITTLVLIISLMLKAIGQKFLLPTLAFSLILFSLPYAYENTLAGFQAQFYFSLLFSMTTLWLIVKKPPLSIAWWIGLFSGGLAFFSLASGIFSIAAATAMGIVFFILKLRRDPAQFLAVSILICVLILGILYTPSIPYHISLKAHSPQQFFYAFFTILSWPLNNIGINTLFLNLPAIIFICFILWQRPKASDPKWFLLGAIIWACIQSASIAYGRNANPLAPRYLDLYAILTLINFICLLSIFDYFKLNRYRLTILSCAIWIILTLIAVASATQESYGQIQLQYMRGQEQQVNTRDYVTTGNMTYLENKSLFSIPYPDAHRLALILNKPSIRSILPQSIAPSETTKSGRLDSFISQLLAHYWLFLWFGLTSLVLTFFFILIDHFKTAPPLPTE
ncbi:hypothetical protein [Aquirhabdus parva]|uniref:Glycosyltransferase RgtA/B/C/D-like domain-containing protein n=1 Tax=Aquirhabdus parva TaxID=2283318 RepID=A0A345PAG7_9GAMM|nr:hypothetical protein [Aquirhabdus parva]AXI04276.1 hypothetical protein HYN46_16395 [Aquirhabdus parva]